MTQFNKELQTYADQGLRTAADWLSLGREIQADKTARSDANLRGEVVSLFSRDQTQPSPPSRRK